MDIILPFFDHLPTSTWTFFTLNWVQNWNFLTTYPPHLVHLVFEWPQHIHKFGELWSFLPFNEPSRNLKYNYDNNLVNKKFAIQNLKFRILGRTNITMVNNWSMLCTFGSLVCFVCTEYRLAYQSLQTIQVH